jgi:malonate-semialdehyde dehydrogenase (acetylating)/methylmalonate-semialdehyde dehydrogenase
MTHINCLSPLDGKDLGTVEKDTIDSLNKKIFIAQAQQVEWAEQSIKNRAQIMFNYRHLVARNSEELIHSIHQENGKTIDEARAEVDKVIELIEFACSMPAIMMEQGLEVSRGVNCTMTHRPLGVVASITPFNFPLMVPNWTVPIALMAGNAVLLKPSDIVPKSPLLMAKLLKEAGLADGLFSVIEGGADLVQALCDHESIKAVSFVGSTRVAEMVYRAATNNLKRALCLGGAKNHLLVLPDADPKMTAENVVASMSGMAGQRCMAASVMVAVGDCDHIISLISDEARKVVPGTNLGSIISAEAKKRIEHHIATAEEEGAKIILDGRGAIVKGKEGGHYLAPTIIDHVKPHMRAAREEIFGPVLSILRAKNVDEAIAIQNNNPYGNGASVYTQSGAHAKYVRERLSAGMIGTNIGVPVPREPFSFGGMKASKFGAGDITGASSIQFWTELIKYTTKWAAEARTNWMS